MENSGCVSKIVLIGLPYSGKTTVGTLLAERLERSFYDSDHFIMARHGSISDIFMLFGSDYFRSLEKKAIAEISAYENCVIATGGGAVLDEENMENLKREGVVIRLIRDIDLMVLADDRPLASSRQQLERLKEEREHLYQKYMDITVENNGTIEETVEEAVRLLREKGLI